MDNNLQYDFEDISKLFLSIEKSNNSVNEIILCLENFQDRSVITIISGFITELRQLEERNVPKGWPHIVMVLQKILTIFDKIVKGQFDVGFLKTGQDPKCLSDLQELSQNRTSEEINNLLVVSLLHDIGKIRASADHAEHSFDILKQKGTENKYLLGLVRFHDLFGNMHTGEASYPFLADMAMFSSGFENFNRFVEDLILFTSADVSAQGHLDCPRIRTYMKICGILRKLTNTKKSKRQDIIDNLLEKASNLENTKDRLVKLLYSDFHEEDIRNAINPLNSWSLEYLKGFALIKFQYGIYLFEPIMNKLKSIGLTAEKSICIIIEILSIIIKMKIEECEGKLALVNVYDISTRNEDSNALQILLKQIVSLIENEDVSQLSKNKDLNNSLRKNIKVRCI